MENAKKIPQRFKHQRIFGLRGLSEFLGITIQTAFKLHKTGKFPVYAAGPQKLIFLEHEVLSGIKKEKAPVGAGA